MLKFLICFSICFLCIAQVSVSKQAVASDYKITCDITKINGPIVSTSCKSFTLGEKIEITDISGRDLLFNELPIPCSAEIKYTCVSNENCSSITSIMVLQKIKTIPE